MPSPPPSYTAIPPSPQASRPPQVSTSLILRSQTNYGTVQLERGEDDKEQSLDFSVMSLTVLDELMFIFYRRGNPSTERLHCHPDGHHWSSYYRPGLVSRAAGSLDFS